MQTIPAYAGYLWFCGGAASWGGGMSLSNDAGIVTIAASIWRPGHDPDRRAAGGHPCHIQATDGDWLPAMPSL
ncbi:MAG: hypothetical protein WC343_09365, partial [Bacilli bacterium]